MPDVTTQFLMFVPRRRRIGGGGSAINVLPPASNPVSSSVWHGPGAPETIDVHYPNPGSPLAPTNFAFWSVVGSANGEFTDRPSDPANSIGRGYFRTSCQESLRYSRCWSSWMWCSQ
jgi:hypothetical protein